MLIVINNLGIHNDFVATNTYGTFAMPLDALWRPSNPTYSMLLSWPETRQSSAFEGFQYLGVGVLTLLTAIPFVSWLTPYDDKSSSLNRQLLWLGPACIALALLAITNQITVAGEVVLTLPLSPSLIALLDPLRASGRLFWLVTYVLLLLAITTAYRLPPPRAIQLLGAVLGLQVIDMSGTMIATQETTKEAALENQWKYTADPRWPSVIASANDVTFAPTNPFVALDLFQEVAWRSISAGKPVRLVYAARNSRVTDARLAAEQADFDAGELDSRRLYILFPGTKVPGNAESRLLILDGVRMLIPIKVSAQSAPS